ncbi:Proteins of 100 residues with WXG [Mycobacteroides abscessus subsp. abscessus]|uniref:WXG100 family type VII secretion target n=1 Tax=Mycobacteroides abscessus TaxID=36809 RepID=UPI000927BE64|nr:WXG100 family type VII secretion target [Mycobacteroides abscessus]SIL35182.1 Proteins of 100 residues with WXG [Mycobacteroides abscessus subsp. abscessus]SKK47559.1 Proteins of 100 residues with WXG [Mycobacteroides abscessus subsp. bolletii]SLE76316.1 Proteins of 100 residues with WXG [Mycobacteroides abscessus subsp. abscessus]
MPSVSGPSGNSFHVDPTELQNHGKQLHGHADDLKEVHDAAHRAMKDAQAGFGSARSASALSSRIADWEKESAEHHTELTRHGDGHISSAQKFVARDEANRDLIKRAGPEGKV